MPVLYRSRRHLCSHILRLALFNATIGVSYTYRDTALARLIGDIFDISIGVYYTYKDSTIYSGGLWFNSDHLHEERAGILVFSALLFCPLPK